MEGGRGKERKTERQKWKERREGKRRKRRKGEGLNSQDTAAASSVQRE